MSNSNTSHNSNSHPQQQELRQHSPLYAEKPNTSHIRQLVQGCSRPGVSLGAAQNCHGEDPQSHRRSFSLSPAAVEPTPTHLTNKSIFSHQKHIIVLLPSPARQRAVSVCSASVRSRRNSVKSGVSVAVVGQLAARSSHSPEVVTSILADSTWLAEDLC